MSRVLIVDDEPQILRALRINLQARQYDVATASDGREALREARSSRPDVVVLDLGLPDMDGVDVIRHLRTWTPVPIVVLSGRVTSNDKVDALDAGADDYVTKPFNLNELLARIRAVTRRHPDPVQAHRRYEVPAGGQFTFENPPGEERLFVVLTREPETDLEKLIYSLNKSDGTPSGGQPKVLTVQAITDDLIGRLRTSIAARDLVFEKVDDQSSDRKEKAAYVVNATGATGGRVVKDLSLKHQ